jgi:hypothetical protein
MCGSRRRFKKFAPCNQTGRSYPNKNLQTVLEFTEVSDSSDSLGQSIKTGLFGPGRSGSNRVAGFPARTKK